MARFEYRHPDGTIIEVEFPVGEAPPSITVDGRICERVISNVGVIFKGDNWGAGKKEYSI